MAINVYTKKHEDLRTEVENFLYREFYNLQDYWKKSDHSLGDVLKITNENLQFTLENGFKHYLTEFNGKDLISNYGYRYDISVLSTKKLCLLADAFNQKAFL